MVCSNKGTVKNWQHHYKISIFSSVGFAALLLIFSVNTQAATLVVPAGSSLQAAVNAAQPGDTIIIAAGATYSQIVLPNKSGTAEILIQSSRASELPAGVRVTPAQAPLMARIQTSNVDPALSTALAAHNYRFVGIEFTVTVNNTYSIVRLDGLTQTSLDQVPRNITLDRCWIHGQPTLNVQAGVTMNAGNVTVTNSYIDEIHWVGVQSYGLGAFNGPGPFLIDNNTIRAAGLNIIFGGSTPSIANLVASDLTITRNHLFKPLEWKGKWTNVNLLELKSARRGLIADNILENNWPDAQVGWAVIFNTFRDGGWEVVEDIQFLRNTIRNSTNGINLRGLDTGDTFVRMKRITVADNRLEGLGVYGFEAKPFQLLGGSEDVTFNHNTVTNSTHSLLMDCAPAFKHLRLKYINNLVPHGNYGVFSDGGAIGTDAMALRASSWSMDKNGFVALPGDLQSKYANNYFPSTAAGASGLLGTDGLPVGVRTGDGPFPTPTPTPTPSATPTPTPTPTATPTTTPTPTPTPIPTPTPSGITVSVTNPTSNSTFSLGANVTVSATASHQNGSINSVAFQANSQLIGTATIAPYSITWSNIASGMYSVTAVAKDTQGLAATSSPITVKVSKALKGVRNGRKNASIIEGSITASGFNPNTAVQAASSQIDSLVIELEQTYLDFHAERSMFPSGKGMDDYLFAALFLARSSASLAKEQSQNNAIADRMNKLDAYLSFCEDLMVSGAISQASLAAATQVNAKVNLVILQPKTRPVAVGGLVVSPGARARISSTSSNPLTTQTETANGSNPYELGNVSVTIKGQAAELLSVSPTAVEFLIPSDLAGGLAEVVVTSRGGFISYSSAAVAGLNPTILMNADTSNRGAILNALNIHSGTFSTVTPAQYLGLDSRTRLSILATGISTGLSNTDFNNDILLANGSRLDNLAESVQVEARTSTGATVKLPVEYAGEQGVLPGVDQVNVVLPAQLAGAGSVQLTIVVGSVRSTPITIVVQ